MKRTTILATVLSLLLIDGAARAEPAPQCVELSPALCSVATVDREAYFHALRVELSAAGFAVQTAACTPSGIVVSVEPAECTADARELLIELSLPGTSRIATRAFSVEDVALSLRPRTLALATAELVVRFGEDARATPAQGALPASDVTAPAKGGPPVPAANASVPSRAPVAIPALPPPLPISRPRPATIGVLGATAEYRDYVKYATPLVGGRLSSAWNTARRGLELRGDALFGEAQREVSLGRVALHLFAAAIGVQWVLRVAPFELFAGANTEVGYAWTAGRPTGAASGGSGGRATFALLADTGVRLRFAPHWAVLLGAGAGAEFAGLRALVDGAASPGVTGPVVVLRGGVGYEF